MVQHVYVVAFSVLPFIPSLKNIPLRSVSINILFFSGLKKRFRRPW